MTEIICLMGPTASGKTKLAMEWVQQKPFEIVSVDSAMVYREMDIGTAKPTADELAIAPHHLINLRAPDETYSVANFCDDANKAIQEILSRGKQPILVGGTMLYFKALQEGLSVLPEADLSVRQMIEDEAAKWGWPYLHDKLAGIDSVAAQRIKPNDSQRIERALEVFEITGETLTALQGQKIPSRYCFVSNAIMPKDRNILRKRIETRFDAMLDAGLIDEVKLLCQRYPKAIDMPSFRMVGYRQVLQYLQGEFDKKTMREKAIIATCQLAKRQMTWLRSWPDITFLEMSC